GLRSGPYCCSGCLAVPLPPELCAGQKESHSALHCPIILWRGEKSPRTGGIKTPVFATPVLAGRPWTCLKCARAAAANGKGVGDRRLYYCQKLHFFSSAN